MLSFRLLLLALATAVFASGCGCGRAPINNTLKAEGEACEADEECESSLCDKLPGKPMVCFRKCAVGCKPGDLCTALAVGDRFACVPERPGLCQACALNVDCPYPGDKCLEIGGTKVCGRDCSFDGVCPTSYRCADGTDTNDEYVTKQCQPISGTCECVAANAGQTKPCSETNAIGTCVGVQTCRPPNGYDACSAHVPTGEVCNGRDDDCNGQTDENLGDTTCGVGECRRTVSNCANGAPQTCVAGSPNTEICDERDNNCDSVVDEGFDKMTSLEHCGACNMPCIRANATAVCGAGMCTIGMCNPGWTNADGIDLNGCEYPCTPTGAEVCDGVDNDCNGQTDEGFQLATDPNNCGVCGRVCNVNNGNVMTYACIAGQCDIATCSTGYQNCDQAYATGCEQHTQSDINNCGTCNTRCMTANGTPVCTSGVCGIGSCTAPFDNCDSNVMNGCETNTDSSLSHCGACGNACPTRNNAQSTCNGSCGYTCTAGFTDLDGLASNGCEYACLPTGVDDPDDSFTDTNCDGIDGDASRAIFVHPMGNDLAEGTRAAPKRTVQAGINAANTTAKPHVYIAAGTYNEAVTLRNGISVYGGFSATNWSRIGAGLTTTIVNNTATSGRIVAVTGSAISLPTTFAYLSVRTGNASSGQSTYGIYCTGCTALTLSQLIVQSGAGGAGVNGAVGAGGAVGARGLDGENGCNDSTSSSCGLGGTGANPVCASSRGGNGGQGGGGHAYGNVGGSGLNAAGVAATSGGSAGGRDSCNGFRGGDGTDGSTGGTGSSGSGGSGFIITAGYAVIAGGGSGGTGVAGNGGGGGGGGGGQGISGIDACISGRGNGGGGGGSGGCGGAGGSGGGGGGASFALFVVNSTGLRVENSQLTSGQGGRGGDGGNGGTGGTGGGGGTGASYQTDEIGAGGHGGDGGRGGTGGRGGGGAGGPSYAVYRIATVSLSLVNVTYANGGGGQGGAGGVAGAAGVGADTN